MLMNHTNLNSTVIKFPPHPFPLEQIDRGGCVILSTRSRWSQLYRSQPAASSELAHADDTANPVS